MFTKADCIDYTQLISIFIVCMAFVVGYYIYIDYQIKMVTTKPEKKNKITVRVLAAGFAMAYSAMLLPTAKETLDFQVYQVHVELYFVTRALLFLGMVGFGLITGGTFLSNIKGNGRN